MGLQEIYYYLAEENKDINKVYEKKKSENRKDFEKHKIKYWCWLIKLNIDHRVFKKNILKDNNCVEKKQENLKQPSVKDFISHYDLVRGIWQFEGVTDELITMLEIFNQSFECWQKENNLIWLIYVSSLLERNNIEKAKKILNKYIKRYGLKDIERFVLVSKFAIDIGISSIEIRKTVGIWKTLKNNIGREKFEDWIKGKKIAIVGNSGVELGKGKGKEIDSHDVIVRFNNYPLTGHEIDYGSKTDVWIRGGNNEVEDRNIANIHSMIYEPDFKHTIMNRTVIDIVCRNLSTYPQKVFYWDYEMKMKFRKESKISNPSSGCFAIWYIYQVLGTLEGVDIYGFGFMGEKVDVAHYYDNLCKISEYHDVLGEKEFICELYRKSGISIFEEDKSTKSYEIITCAYRDFDIKKGATGGPGGVCYMQKELLGNKFRNVTIKYLFKEAKVNSGILKASQGLNSKIKYISLAADYILNNKAIAKSLQKNKKVLFICHDIGSAYGAYLLGCDYVIVYHQQGSLVNEIKASSMTMSNDEYEILQYIETVVFKNAYKVYFPSNGSLDVFKKTTLIGTSDLKSVNFSDYALYNTICSVDKRVNIADVLKELNIAELYNTHKEIFISVADFNFDKGVDRIPDFLSKYVKKTGKEIVWIAIGNASNQELFNSLNQKKEYWSFEAHLYGNRIEHDRVLELYEWADYYIMLHRNSIFDLATLEAMRAGDAVILSDSKSNYEFNKENNVLIVNDMQLDDAINQMLNMDLKEWKRHNKLVFNKYFSQEKFTENYISMLNDFTQKKIYFDECNKSSINIQNLSEWKDKYKDKKVIICGSGSSLDFIKEQKKDYIYIALNKAVFYSKIKFDFLFMQDYPCNQVYTLEDYNSYNCVKFYGIVTNPQMKKMGLDKDLGKFEKIMNKLYRYELSPVIFDYRADKFNYFNAENYFSDAQSVLFSALQFAVYAGFQSIHLCGVDFSNVNYGNDINMSKYACNVVNNLVAFKNQLKIDKPNVSLEFLSTTNVELVEKFYDIDHKEDEVIVSGIYTENYKKMVDLQESTCEDNYKFDFRYITDEEWNKKKGNGEFAFFGGNTIKTQLVIDKINEYWGKILIVTDADLLFLQKTRSEIMYNLIDNDMLFLRERRSNQELYERAIENINIGFVAMKCNQASLDFWEKVQKETIDTQGWDQEVANIILHEKRSSLKWQMLTENFLNGGAINAENIGNQKICTASGTIAKRKGLSKYDFLLTAYNYAKRQKWFEN